MKKAIAIVLSIMLVLAVSLPAAAISTIAVKSIKLDNAQISVQIGQTADLKVTFTPANTSQTKLTYVTSNKNVVTVNTTGKITAIHAGEATITVYTLNNKVFAKCNVIVPELKYAKIKMYLLGDRPIDIDMVYAKINDILKQKLNATLSTEYLSWADYKNQYSLVLSSGEGVDLMYTSDWAFYTQEATKGAFLELTKDFLNKNMPMTMKSQAPSSWNDAAISGKIYCIPQNADNFQEDGWVMARKDLLDKYGMQTPKSVKDLENYYDAVIKNETNILPYSASGSGIVNVGPFFSVDVQYPNNFIPAAEGYQFYYKYVAGKKPTEQDILDIYETPQYKAHIEKMKTWADKGYWSKSAVTNNITTRDAFKNGQSASMTQGIGTAFTDGEILHKNNPSWTYQLLELNPGTIRRNGVTTGNAIAIAASSKNPERAAMVVDLIKNNSVVWKLINAGIEGVHYTEVNSFGLTTTAKGPRADKYSFEPGTWCFIAPAGKMLDYPEVSQASADFRKMEVKMAINPPTKGNRFDETPVKSEVAAINAIRNQYLAALELGAFKDPDASLAEMISKMKAAGIDKVKAEVNKQVQEFMSSLK